MKNFMFALGSSIVVGTIVGQFYDIQDVQFWTIMIGHGLVVGSISS